MPVSASSYDIDKIECALSEDRFAPYVQSASGDRYKALELYRLNILVSSCLYLPLQTLEVCLRNAFHDRLSSVYGEWWFNNNIVVSDYQRQSDVSRAIQKLNELGKVVTPGRVVASLSFGFWTWCTTNPCQDAIWRRGGVSKSFPGARSFPTQGNVNSMLTPLRHLRNRVAHHEPILYLPLEKAHRHCLTLTEWINPEMARWAYSHSTFDSVFLETDGRTMLAPKHRIGLR